MRKNKLFDLVVVGALFLLVLDSVLAQEKRESAASALETLMGKRLQGLPQVQAVPMEGVVDPAKYIVGPSDAFSINIWSELALSFDSNVTPEGTLIVPTVGEVKVAGMTLAEARESVVRALKRVYLSGEVSMTLVSPRRFVVTVTGSVLNQGSYIATSVERVDKLVVEANRMVMPSNTVVVEPSPVISYTPYYMQQKTVLEQMQINNEQNQVAQILNRISSRNIVLYRRDGTKQRVDILKYNATKDDRYNPFLLDGDVIFVPRKDLIRDFVSVYGAVNNPGAYEFTNDDSVYALIKIAGGLTMLADSAAVAISRLGSDGSKEEIISVPLREIIAGKVPDIPLHRGDRISVPEKEQLRQNYSVVVRGEVRSPGQYPITKGSTRLSEAIKKAGGFTQYAYLRGAEVIRGVPSVQESNMEKLMSFRLGTALPARDTAYYNLETNMRIIRGVAWVDFEKLFIEGDSSQDIYLRDGDVILVPSIAGTVYISGRVANPGYVPFLAGKNYEYYVNSSGGYLDDARVSDVKIIKARTRQWVDAAGDIIIDPGDQIWVPKKPDRDFAYYFRLVQDGLTVVAGSATIYLLIQQLSK